MERDVVLLERAAAEYGTDVNQLLTKLTRGEDWELSFRWARGREQFVVEMRHPDGRRLSGASDHTPQGALARAVLRMLQGSPW